LSLDSTQRELIARLEASRENGMSRKERRRAVLQAVLGYRFNVAELLQAIKRGRVQSAG
jgi:hypothetical protein